MSRVCLLVSFCALAPFAAAQNKRWPYDMDYGPALMTTVDCGGRAEFSLKTVAVPLQGRGGVAFDTELLRVAAAWSGGFLNLVGTAYDGAHGPMPKARGHRLCESAALPGWARNGSFDDPRSEPFGPLPREWGRYRGLYLDGARVVLSYQVDGMDVLEGHAIDSAGAVPVFVRMLELGPCDREQTMLVLDCPKGVLPGTVEGKVPGAVPNLVSFALLQWQENPTDPVRIDTSPVSWDDLAMGGPSNADYADRTSKHSVTMSWVPGFSLPHGVQAPKTGQPGPELLSLPKLHDGRAAQNDNDTERSVWFDSRKVGNREVDDGRVHVDLQRAVAVSRVSTFSWHHGRARQDYELFASAADAPPALDAKDLEAAGWQRLGRINTDELGNTDRHGATITGRNGTLGTFRHLLLNIRRGECFLSEIDVWAGEKKAEVDSKPSSPQNLVVAAIGDKGTAELRVAGTRILMVVPPHAAKVALTLRHGSGDKQAVDVFSESLQRAGRPEPLQPHTKGGPPRWGSPIITQGKRGVDEGAYAVDTLTIPMDNKYGSRMRVCGLDFFADGRAAVSTWNGDVWIVSGIDDKLQELQWRRYATGLFDPLGLRIVDGKVYVHGRDGITRLHDLNGDGEADFYECFNNEVHATRGFHEFSFDLQTDAAGNFYFSKGGPVNPGGRGFQQIAEHHGTIMKLSPDGQRLEVIATGLRAPNGIGVGPHGEITSGDNEGTWMPRCRLNFFTRPGFYAGVKDTAHRTPVPDQPDLPLCWLPMEVDNSGGGQVWVTSDRWGPWKGRLLHMSYGTSSLYLALAQMASDQIQGGVVRFPVDFTSSCMRARFHPVDGQLYVTGFQGWQTNAGQEGGFNRVRYTGKPVLMPTDLRVTDKGIHLTFLEPLDPESAGDPGSYGVEIWNYLYSQAYGSPEISILHPERKREQGKENRDPLPIVSAKLSDDRRSVFLEVPAIQPVMQMKISWNIESAKGEKMRGELHNTIHALPSDQGAGSGGR